MQEAADVRDSGATPDGAEADADATAPIRVHLDRLLADREMTLTDLSDQVGVTVANLSILKNGHARAIRFSTLSRLCEALDCQPGDLLSYEISSGNS
jgi:putative transcriptional regulator